MAASKDGAVPNDCKVAKMLPAATLPMEARHAAASEPSEDSFQ